MVIVNGNSIDDIATYICDLGFELIGCATTTCILVDLDSAEFQPALPPSCRREYTECSLLFLTRYVFRFCCITLFVRIGLSSVISLVNYRIGVIPGTQ